MHRRRNNNNDNWDLNKLASKQIKAKEPKDRTKITDKRTGKIDKLKNQVLRYVKKRKISDRLRNGKR